MIAIASETRAAEATQNVSPFSEKARNEIIVENDTLIGLMRPQHYQEEIKDEESNHSN